MLAEHYITSFRNRLRRKIDGISPEALEAFRRYEWPGNVRELRNVIERAMILEDDETITTRYLPRGLTGDAPSNAEPRADGRPSDPFRLPGKGISLDEVELSLVRQALQRSGGNQTKAAELLHISRDQLRYRMKKVEEAGAAAVSEPLT